MATPIKDTKLNTLQSREQLVQPAPKPINNPTANQPLPEPKNLNDLVKTYFNRAEKNPVKEEISESPSIFLSRFGLKTSGAIDQFLASPAGKEVITEMTQEFANEKAREEQRQIARQDHELLIRRIKIVLFLWFLEKEAHASDKIKELINAQIEKKLGQPKAHSSEHNALDEAKRQANLQAVLNDYTQKIVNAESARSSLKSDENKLLSDLAGLEQLEIQRIAKYALYSEHLTDEQFNAFLTEDGIIDTAAITKEHAQLQQQMEALYIQIDERITNDEDPSELIQQQNALNLKFANLHDLLSVHKGTKYYTDAEGQPVKNLQHSSFILNKDEKIVYEQGQYYLLKPSQSWEAVKEHPEAMQQAKAQFERSKTEIMTVKKVVSYNRGAEETAHNNTVENKQFALNVNNAEQRLIENQIRLLQSARSEVQAALAAPSLSLRPTITPSVTTHTQAQKSTAPRPSPQMVQVYKQELERLKLVQQVTQEDLLTLASKAPGVTNQTNAQLYIKALFASGGTRIGSLPPQFKEQLFKRMEEFGGVNPLRDQQQATPPASTYKSPTPFDMRPNPYKS